MNAKTQIGMGTREGILFSGLPTRDIESQRELVLHLSDLQVLAPVRVSHVATASIGLLLCKRGSHKTQPNAPAQLHKQAHLCACIHTCAHALRTFGYTAHLHVTSRTQVSARKHLSSAGTKRQSRMKVAGLFPDSLKTGRTKLYFFDALICYIARYSAEVSDVDDWTHLKGCTKRKNTHNHKRKPQDLVAYNRAHSSCNRL